MFAVLIATFVVAFVLFCLRFPVVWLSFMAIDDSLDVHELGLALVASRECTHLSAASLLAVLTLLLCVTRQPFP
jgi:hypothetical protein